MFSDEQVKIKFINKHYENFRANFTPETSDVYDVIKGVVDELESKYKNQKIVIDITDSDADDFSRLANDEAKDIIEWTYKSDKGCMIDVEFISAVSLEDN